MQIKAVISKLIPTRALFNKKALLDYALILVGGIILAIGVQKFLAPVHLVAGGLTGISIILQHLFNISIPTSTLLLNLPLFAIWMYQRGISSVIRTILTVLYLTFAYYFCGLLPDILPRDNALMLATIYGSLGLGVGMGLILRGGSSSGGTDMAANLLNYKVRSIPIANFMFSMDVAIIVAGAITFGIDKALYSIMTAFLTSKIVSFMLSGGRGAKAIWVISSHVDIIAPKLQEIYKRNGAMIDVIETYSSEDKGMLYMVIPKSKIFRVQNLIMQIDQDAFITVTDVREVWGMSS